MHKVDRHLLGGNPAGQGKAEQHVQVGGRRFDLFGSCRLPATVAWSA
jgi:hypothetical protein